MALRQLGKRPGVGENNPFHCRVEELVEFNNLLCLPTTGELEHKRVLDASIGGQLRYVFGIVCNDPVDFATIQSVTTLSEMPELFVRADSNGYKIARPVRSEMGLDEFMDPRCLSRPISAHIVGDSRTIKR